MLKKKTTFVLSYCIVLKKKQTCLSRNFLFFGEEECSVVQKGNLSVLGA